MKKLAIILFLTIATVSMAQEKNTISLRERVKYVDKNPTYYASVVVSPYYANYGGSTITIQQLIKGFEEKLEQNNIDKNDLKEDEVGYISMSLGKPGKLYHYKTTSKKALLKFINMNTLGSSRLSYDYGATLDPVEEGKIINNAIEKARTRANEIASGMGKKVGNIIKLNTNFDGNEWLRGIFRDNVIGELIFDIEVDFELLE